MKRPMTQGGKTMHFAAQKNRVLCIGRKHAGTVTIQKSMAERRSRDVVPEEEGMVFSMSVH